MNASERIELRFQNLEPSRMVLAAELFVPCFQNYEIPIIPAEMPEKRCAAENQRNRLHFHDSADRVAVGTFQPLWLVQQSRRKHELVEVLAIVSALDILHDFVSDLCPAIHEISSGAAQTPS